jgi:hypothetical protein
MAFLCGYLYRDHRLQQHTVSLHDVRVIRKDAEDMYLLQAGIYQFEAKFCRDYLPDFDPGTTLKVLVYEDRGQCKSIGGQHNGFLVARDVHGMPIKFTQQEIN